MNSPAPKELTTDNIPTENTGFIEGSGTEDLWLAGTIPYEVILELGDWRPFLPSGEKQKNPAETMSCVSFSHLNSLEIQTKQQTGQQPNWSDRFLAKMSGTTHHGNKLDVVADIVRNVGLVNESVWPAPPGLTWDQFYSAIPQSVIDQAVKPDIAYESIVPGASELRYHLKQCPIQIVIPEPYPNHAVVAVAIEENTVFYFDSYSPYLKNINVTKIHAALKIVLKGNMTNAYVVKNGGEYAVASPATSEDGLITLLRSHGLPVPLKLDGKLDFAEIDKITHVL